MINKRIIGLCGPKGAGKSTIARSISEMSTGVAMLSFATPMKLMLAAVDIPHSALYGDDKEKPLGILGGKTARHAMQTLGTQWGRDCIYPEFWGDLWEYKARMAQADIVVVDDVRFDNEARRIKRLGGRLFCVVRSMPDFDVQREHESEAFADLPHDEIIVNEPACDHEKACSEIARMILSRA